MLWLCRFENCALFLQRIALRKIRIHCLLEIDYMHQGDLLNCSNILTDSEAYAGVSVILWN